MEFLDIERFDKVDDPVKTEQQISEQMRLLAGKISLDFSYVSIPLAWNINNIGILNTQRKLDEICSSNSHKKLFFVCQHILVNKLNFHGNDVFTPHATILNSFNAIPHYSCTYDTSKAKPWPERKYNFSFMGSFRTHPVRKRLAEALSHRDDCLIIDTGEWHFEGNVRKQQENANKYIEILGDTKYSLCPRGTGPSTIRIWEAMAMGSKPVIFSDFLKMPLDMQVSLDAWAKIPENFSIKSFDSILANDQRYDNSEYNEIFSNDKLYQSIIYNLQQ